YQETDGYLALTEEARKVIDQQADEDFKELVASGEFVGASALADPTTATTARSRDGQVVMTDGPYQESKEQLAGYFIFDCESKERAEEIARGFPDARWGAVEVRAIMGADGQEM
ncbi:MAG: YciI family protein, partial [Nonomuraea sp.]|nr:YciI family protein [Nonomuraea sp.]